MNPGHRGQRKIDVATTDLTADRLPGATHSLDAPTALHVEIREHPLEQSAG